MEQNPYPPPPPTAPHAMPYPPPPEKPVKPPAPVARPPGAEPESQKTPVPQIVYNMPTNLGKKPVVLLCPQCQHRGPSTVTSDNCTAVNWACTLFFCLCCFFCIPATAKHTHTCSKCGGYLGSNNIM